MEIVKLWRVSFICIYLFYIFFQVVPVLLNLLYEISSVRLYLPKDLRPSDARHTVYKSLEETKK